MKKNPLMLHRGRVVASWFFPALGGLLRAPVSSSYFAARYCARVRAFFKYTPCRAVICREPVQLWVRHRRDGDGVGGLDLAKVLWDPVVQRAGRQCGVAGRARLDGDGWRHAGIARDAAPRVLCQRSNDRRDCSKTLSEILGVLGPSVKRRGRIRTTTYSAPKR